MTQIALTLAVLPSGHSRHCVDAANDLPDSSKQHWAKDNEVSLNDSPPQ